MPANKKYLTKSPWIRFSRIMAGVVGGYIVMLTFHMLLTRVLPRENVVATSFFTGYILWAILLLQAFLIEKAWKVWLLYAGISIVFALPQFIY